VRNVQLSGGVACIVANNVSGGFEGTLGDGNSSTIPAVGVSMEDGAAMKSFVGTLTTVSTLVNNNVSSYDAFDGTSMATPHVSGVAALIWSKYPGATNAQVRQALINSAEDLGTPGRDSSYGYGLVRANAALSALAALNPAGAGDTTAPVISALAAKVTNAKNGSFEITWTTNEPATSDVQVNNTLYPDATLVTNHRRNLRGTKGATYTYVVISKDAAGNVATSAPQTITLK
jgi:serine protease